MGSSDEATKLAAMWMSISSGRSARDLVGAIGRRVTRRAKEVGLVCGNGGGKRLERGRERSGNGMRGPSLVSFPYVAIKENPKR